MKSTKKLLAILGLVFSTTSCSVSNEFAFNNNRFLMRDNSGEEQSYDDNPVLNAVKNNKGVSVLLLENGLRDGSGFMNHESLLGIESKNFMNNTDGYIIKAGDYEVLVDCGMGLSKSPDLVSKEAACLQLSKIMDYLCEDHVWDAVIFTHPHSDHIMGASYFINIAAGIAPTMPSFSIDKIYDFALPNGSYPNVSSSIIYQQEYIGSMRVLDTTVSDKHISVPSYFYKENGDEIKVIDNKKEIANLKVNNKDFRFNFLKNPDYNKNTNNPNLISISFIINYGNQKLLFTGDLEAEGESYLINTYGEDIENITVYKAGHHGSASNDDGEKKANSYDFINHIRPQYVMVPAVAGSIEYNNKNQETTFPAYAAVDRFFKYTDYIYIPSSAIFSNDEYVDYASLYGDIGFLLNGVNTVDVKTTNLADQYDKPYVPIYNTKWFDQNRDAFFAYHTLIEESGNSNYSNCSLFKFGHIDILIDCGSRNSNGSELIKKLEKLVVDKKIEYLVVSHGNFSAISGLVALKEEGVLRKFTIGKVIDFGDDCNIEESEKDAPSYTYYKKFVRSFGDKYVPVNDTKYVYDVAKIREYSDYGTNKFVEDGTGSFENNLIQLTVIDPLAGKSNDEFNNSLSTIITYKNKKIVNIGGLDDTNSLTSEYKDLIKNATLYRCSNSPTDYANSEEFLNVLKPKYAVVAPSVNNKEINYCANKEDLERILRANDGRTKVYVSSYIGNKGKQLLCGSTSFKFYYDLDDVLVFTTSDTKTIDQDNYVITSDERGEGNEVKELKKSTVASIPF